MSTSRTADPPLLPIESDDTPEQEAAWLRERLAALLARIHGAVVQ